jgi:hypothetical protein
MRTRCELTDDSSQQVAAHISHGEVLIALDDAEGTSQLIADPVSGGITL